MRTVTAVFPWPAWRPPDSDGRRCWGWRSGRRPGCGREFFREWANQDVSEAVFEKSRDPRWRLDLFSIEPPALSRYADPYDPDRPPAPPDDYATEALRRSRSGPTTGCSCRPRGPATSTCSTPGSGSGPYRPPAAAGGRRRPRRRPPTPPATTVAGRRPPAAAAPAGARAGRRRAAAARANSGPAAAPMSPLPVPTRTRPPTRRSRRRAGPPDARPPARHGRRSRPQARQPRAETSGSRLAAFQDTGLPMPVPPPAPRPAARRPPGRRRDIPTPPIGMDPDPRRTPTSSAPVNPPPRPDPRASTAPPRRWRRSWPASSSPARSTSTRPRPPACPANSKPYVITMEQAFTLALINSRRLPVPARKRLPRQPGRHAPAVRLHSPSSTPGSSPLTGVAGRRPAAGGFPRRTRPTRSSTATRATGTPGLDPEPRAPSPGVGKAVQQRRPARWRGSPTSSSSTSWARTRSSRRSSRSCR